jgi:hypothetical protein
VLLLSVFLTQLDGCVNSFISLHDETGGFLDKNDTSVARLIPSKRIDSRCCMMCRCDCVLEIVDNITYEWMYIAPDDDG